MDALAKDVALRIALAARALPDTEVKTLLLGLLAQLGEPLSGAKLNKLRLGKLKRIPELEEIDEPYLKAALDCLKGRNIDTEPQALPPIQTYVEGDMPDSIRVACASNSGGAIDGHFGSCARFLIYQLGADELRLVDIRTPRAVADEEDKNQVRAEALADCQVLYTVSVGGPAAAKVIRAGLHPLKLPQGGDAVAVLQRLQQALAESPPPWLAKVMGRQPEQRARIRQQVSE